MKKHVTIMNITVCLVLAVLLCPALMVHAAEPSPEIGDELYRFDILGWKLNVESGYYGPGEFARTHVLEFLGGDIDFVSNYYWYLTPEGKRCAMVCLYAFSDEPFMLSSYKQMGGPSHPEIMYNMLGDYKSVNTYRLDGQSISNTPYMLEVLIGSEYSDNDPYLFDTFEGLPNKRMVEVDGADFNRFDYVKDLVDEYKENCGFDWKVDVAEFDDWYLTGVDYVKLKEDMYKFSWKGTSLGSKISVCTNQKVIAFVRDKVSDSSYKNVKLGECSIGDNEFVVNISKASGFNALFSPGHSWDGVVYLQPQVNCNGQTYVGSLVKFDVNSKVIVTVPAGGENKTVDLNDFYLTNLSLIKGIADSGITTGRYKVTWSGVTHPEDLVYIPDDKTAVIAVVALEYADGTIENREVASTTIGKGKFYFDQDKLLNIDSAENVHWDGYIYVGASYVSEDGVFYSGPLMALNTLTGDAFVDVLDEENGTVNREQITDPSNPTGNGSSFTSSSMTTYVSDGFNFLKNLINMMSVFPSLVADVFQFIPSFYINAIGVMFIIIFIARVLGR